MRSQNDGLARQVERHDVLGLVVLQAGDDHRLQLVQRRRFGGLRCDGAPARGPAAAAFLRGVPGVCRQPVSVGLATFLRGAARCRAGRGRLWRRLWRWHVLLWRRGSRWPRRRAAAPAGIPRPGAAHRQDRGRIASRAVARAQPLRRLARPGRGDCSRAAAARRTACGARTASQPRQRGNCSRMSAPISQTNCDSRKPPPQAAQRVDGVAGAEQRLDPGGDDAPAIGDAARGGQTLLRTAPCRVAASADCRARPAARPDPAATAAVPARRRGDGLHAPD